MSKIKKNVIRSNRDEGVTQQILNQQAASNLETTGFRDQQIRRRLLEKLSQATRAILGNAGALTLAGRLDLIVKHTAEILQAECAGIFLAHQDGFLRLEASVGHHKNGFPKGMEIRVISGEKTGLTGHIVAEGKLVNLSGKALSTHPAVKGLPAHAKSKECHSLLAIPIKRIDAGKETLVGLLRADNKISTHHPFQFDTQFSQEDEWVLQMLAGMVVEAIDNDKLVKDLAERERLLEKLISISPTAIIANDEYGVINVFNQQAKDILGYSSGEIIGKHVSSLYENPQDAFEIGQLVRDDSQNRIANYNTMLRSKTGEKVPIRLTATTVNSSQGELRVGYFEDLTILRRNEAHLQVSYQASQQLISSQDPHTILDEIIQNAEAAFRAVTVSMVLMDKWGQLLHTMTSKNFVPADSSDIVRSNGLSMQLLNAGKPLIIPDINKQPNVNPSEFWQSKQSAIGLPLSLREQAIGVMWLFF